MHRRSTHGHVCSIDREMSFQRQEALEPLASYSQGQIPHFHSSTGIFLSISPPSLSSSLFTPCHRHTWTLTQSSLHKSFSSATYMHGKHSGEGASSPPPSHVRCLGEGELSKIPSNSQGVQEGSLSSLFSCMEGMCFPAPHATPAPAPPPHMLNFTRDASPLGMHRL